MKIERSVGEQLKLDCYGICEKARICYVASDVAMDEIDDAVNQVYAMAPVQWENIPKQSVEILHSPGGGMVEIAVNYREENYTAVKKYNGKKEGDRVWNVEVHARQHQLKSAVSLISSHSFDGNTPPDPGTLVDWNGRAGLGSVSGRINAYRPEFILSCTATFSKKKAQSNSYLRRIAALVGKVNSENFHQWAAGEVLFLGLSGSSVFQGKNGEELCNMTFRFSIRCNGARELDERTIQNVDGWDYLWGIRRRRDGQNRLTSAYVSRIYERAAFSVLNL